MDRGALAYDRGLCADVLDAFVSALMRSLRRRAKRHLGLRSMMEPRREADPVICDGLARELEFQDYSDTVA